MVVENAPKANVKARMAALQGAGDVKQQPPAGEEVVAGWMKKAGTGVLASREYNRYCVLYAGKPMHGFAPTLLYFEDEARSKPKGQTLLADGTAVEQSGLTVRLSQAGNKVLVKLTATTTDDADHWRSSLNGVLGLETDTTPSRVEKVATPPPAKLPATVPPPAKPQAKPARADRLSVEKAMETARLEAERRISQASEAAEAEASELLASGRISQAETLRLSEAEVPVPALPKPPAAAAAPAADLAIVPETPRGVPSNWDLPITAPKQVIFSAELGASPESQRDSPAKPTAPLQSKSSLGMLESLTDDEEEEAAAALKPPPPRLSLVSAPRGPTPTPRAPTPTTPPATSPGKTVVEIRLDHGRRLSIDMSSAPPPGAPPPPPPGVPPPPTARGGVPPRPPVPPPLEQPGQAAPDVEGQPSSTPSLDALVGEHEPEPAAAVTVAATPRATAKPNRRAASRPRHTTRSSPTHRRSFH